MSPFHDLGRHCGGPLPAASAWSLPSPGSTQPALGRPELEEELLTLSLAGFVRLLLLGAVGLALLLSLGVGGVALVQHYVFRPSKVMLQEGTGVLRRAETSSLACADENDHRRVSGFAYIPISTFDVHDQLEGHHRTREFSS